MFDVIYRWIRLNELYKLLESFFQISESFFELTTVFQIIVALGFCMRGGEAFLLLQTAALQLAAVFLTIDTFGG